MPETCSLILYFVPKIATCEPSWIFHLRELASEFSLRQSFVSANDKEYDREDNLLPQFMLLILRQIRSLSTQE
jgi:hypothetical protein